MSLRRTTTTTITTTTAGVNSAENLKKSCWKRAVFALNPLTQWFPKLHRLIIPLPFVQQDCQFCRNDIIYYVLWSFEARVVFVSMWSGRVIWQSFYSKCPSWHFQPGLWELYEKVLELTFFLQGSLETAPLHHCTTTTPWTCPLWN